MKRAGTTPTARRRAGEPRPAPRPRPDDVLAALAAHREPFKRYLQARLGSAADVDDLLQNALVKALQQAPGPAEQQKLVPWFYRVLRNAAIDHRRSRQAAARREQMWSTDTWPVDGSDQPELCACFERLLPTLRPMQAELIRRVELNDQPVAEVARALGLSPNQASVTLHRARAALRAKLILFCEGCACLHACACE